ncbi:MAG: PLP-dependent aspartate aminotransferase family protein [Anaerolineaceae bacterium]
MRKNIDPKLGISTLVNHVSEGDDPLHAHVTPIYQTSTFSFPDTSSGAEIFAGAPGYVYTRWENPNSDHLAEKIAWLEGLDLLRSQPQKPSSEIVAARMLASGMAAVTTAILSKVKCGQKIIAQNSLYSATYTFLAGVKENYGIEVVFTKGLSLKNWKEAFRQAPDAVLVYAETPANPTLALVDLTAVAEMAHENHAWLIVDNTFASPYCQRPLSLGADIVVHSTTKYLSGHGTTIGGVAVSRHHEYIHNEFYSTFKLLGGAPSPFDCWLTELGLKTFELRMAAHCANAQKVAEFLSNHPRVANVYYPGLKSHPDHDLAVRQMGSFGGMVAFEVKGGVKAGAWLMNHVQVATLAVSLGNVDTLIQHPASMTHSHLSSQVRRSMGISDGLVRLSVGIENVEDILNDLDQALNSFSG